MKTEVYTIHDDGTRELSELLQLLLENKNLFRSGLCQWVNQLYYAKIITIKESRILSIYINNNRPSKFSSFSAFIHQNRPYYWEKRKISYRINWINKHIKKL